MSPSLLSELFAHDVDVAEAGDDPQNQADIFKNIFGAKIVVEQVADNAADEDGE